MVSSEYARLRDLWNKYQSGAPGIDATIIRDVTSMDGVTVYDSSGRPSSDSNFEDNLRRPWQNTSAWAVYGVKKGFVRPEDVYKASVELWETGVLFQEPGKTRNFSPMAPPSPEVIQATNQNEAGVPVSVYSSGDLAKYTPGGPFTGGGNTGIAGGLLDRPMPGGNIVLEGEITRSSLPTRELADRVAGAGTYPSPADTYGRQTNMLLPSGAGGLGGMPSWVWLAAAAVAIYVIARES